MTRILAIGDVMGKPGRRALEVLLPKARERFSPDIVLVNGENAAGGFGLTRKVFDGFVGDLGIDAVTMGNHWHDKREIYDFMDHERIVLPANMGNVDREMLGLRVLRAKNGTRFAVVNVVGRAFMKGDNRCPFTAVDKLFREIPDAVKIRIVDVHAEATSEKQGLGWHLAGRASLVYGTHQHVPMADERIMEGKTGYLTDIGMTGPYESVVGIRKDGAVHRLMNGTKNAKWEVATGDPWLCALVADIDDETGHCKSIERLRWELKEDA